MIDEKELLKWVDPGHVAQLDVIARERADGTTAATLLVRQLGVDLTGRVLQLPLSVAALERERQRVQAEATAKRRADAKAAEEQRAAAIR